MDSTNSPTTKPLFYTIKAVWYALGIIETLLAFRFVLKLLGANPGAGFSHFIYSATYPVVAPFLNVFNVATAERSIFEWTTLLAMLVYWVLAFGLVSLFLMGKTVSTPEAAVELQKE